MATTRTARQPLQVVHQPFAMRSIILPHALILKEACLVPQLAKAVLTGSLYVSFILGAIAVVDGATAHRLIVIKTALKGYISLLVIFCAASCLSSLVKMTLVQFYHLLVK